MRKPTDVGRSSAQPASRNQPVRLFGRVMTRNRAVLLLAGLALISLGAYGLAVRSQATNGAPRQLQSSHIIDRSTDRPDETTPADTYEVAADQPRSIILPSVGKRGFIQKVATDQHGAIAVPGNVHVAGWYTGSPKPGQVGNSIIDGHVRGYYADGVFVSLAKLKPGDKVQIEYGDRTTRGFTVIERVSVSADKATEEQYKEVANGGSQLTLITCGGAFDKQNREYKERVIVRARLDV